MVDCTQRSFFESQFFYSVCWSCEIAVSSKVVGGLFLSTVPEVGGMMGCQGETVHVGRSSYGSHLSLG